MLQYKNHPLEACEFRFNDDDWQVTGYASAFNSVDSFNDTVLPGAFAESIKAKVPVMRFEHLRYATPGKWDSAVEDEKGLRVSGHLTRDHSIAKDLRASMRHGTIRGLSIGFWTPEDGFEAKSDGGRILKKINLVEVSFTADPAEPLATIDSFKSEVAAIATLADMEDFLRDTGNLSKSMACTLISQMKAVCLGDPDKAKAQNEAVMQLKSVLDKYDLRKLIA